MTSTKSGPDFAVRLVHARQLASRFSKATDELNAALADAEKALTELRLGVHASVLINQRNVVSDNGTPVTYDFYLTFCKMVKTWQLIVESGLHDGSRDFCASPVCDTSREIRLLAAKHLPSLLEKLIEKAESELQDVEANTDAVKSLVQTIRGFGSDDKGLEPQGAEVIEANIPLQKSHIGGSDRVGVGLVGRKSGSAGQVGASLAGAVGGSVSQVGVSLIGTAGGSVGQVGVSLIGTAGGSVGQVGVSLVGPPGGRTDLTKAHTLSRKSRSREVSK